MSNGKKVRVELAPGEEVLTAAQVQALGSDVVYALRKFQKAEAASDHRSVGYAEYDVIKGVSDE